MRHQLVKMDIVIMHLSIYLRNHLHVSIYLSIHQITTHNNFLVKAENTVRSDPDSFLTSYLSDEFTRVHPTEFTNQNCIVETPTEYVLYYTICVCAYMCLHVCVDCVRV